MKSWFFNGISVSGIRCTAGKPRWREGGWFREVVRFYATVTRNPKPSSRRLIASNLGISYCIYILRYRIYVIPGEPMDSRTIFCKTSNILENQGEGCRQHDNWRSSLEHPASDIHHHSLLLPSCSLFSHPCTRETFYIKYIKSSMHAHINMINDAGDRAAGYSGEDWPLTVALVGKK